MITGPLITSLSLLGTPGRAARRAPYYTSLSTWVLPVALTIGPDTTNDFWRWTVPEYQEYQACQQGDVGVAIVVAVVDAGGNPVDLRGASGLTIRLGRPDGTTVEKAAGFLTDGSDGKLVYSTQALDLNQIGQWSLQGKYAVAGAPKSTAVSAFVVKPNVKIA